MKRRIPLLTLLWPAIWTGSLAEPSSCTERNSKMKVEIVIGLPELVLVVA